MLNIPLGLTLHLSIYLSIYTYTHDTQTSKVLGNSLKPSCPWSSSGLGLPQMHDWWKVVRSPCLPWFSKALGVRETWLAMALFSSLYLPSCELLLFPELVMSLNSSQNPDNISKNIWFPSIKLETALENDQYSPWLSPPSLPKEQSSIFPSPFITAASSLLEEAVYFCVAVFMEFFSLTWMTLFLLSKTKKIK